MNENHLKHETGAFLQLHSQNIPDFIRNKAERELGETNIRRKECLSVLRELIERELSPEVCTSDDFLLQFLRARKYDTDRAFGLVKRYYAHRRDYPALHKVKPDTLKQLSQDSFMSFLPLRSPDGCAIWCVRLGLWDTNYFSVEDIIAFGLMLQKHEVKNPVTQICGMVSILDLKEFSWSHILRSTPSSLRGFVTASLDCLPFRFKAIHVVNHPRVFDFLFAIIKPLLSAKIRERFQFHDDEKDLVKFLPPEILPKAYGGKLDSFENKRFMSSVLHSESTLEKY